MINKYYIKKELNIKYIVDTTLGEGQCNACSSSAYVGPIFLPF